jgi:hypothetical protein
MSRLDPHPDGNRWQSVGVVGTVALFVVHTWPQPDPETGEETAAKRQRTRGEPMKKDNSKPMTQDQAAELKALAALPEDQINTSDLPEQRDWSAARRGLFSAQSKSN